MLYLYKFVLQQRHHGVAAAKGKGTDLKKCTEQFSDFRHRHPSIFLLLDRFKLQIALKGRFVAVLCNKVPAFIRGGVEDLYLLSHRDLAVVIDGGKFHNVIAHDLLRQCIADDIQIKGVVDVVMQVTLGVVRRKQAGTGQVLPVLMQQKGQLLFHRLVPVALHRPVWLAQNVPILKAGHDPAAVHHGNLLPGFVRKGGDALDGTPADHLRAGAEGQSLAAVRYAVKPQRLLAHQKRYAVIFKKLVVHAEFPGVHGGDLLHITQQRAGLEQTMAVCIGIFDHGGVLIIKRFHSFSLLSEKGRRTTSGAAALAERSILIAGLSAHLAPDIKAGQRQHGQQQQ